MSWQQKNGATGTHRFFQRLFLGSVFKDISTKFEQTNLPDYFKP